MEVFDTASAPSVNGDETGDGKISMPADFPSADSLAYLMETSFVHGDVAVDEETFTPQPEAEASEEAPVAEVFEASPVDIFPSEVQVEDVSELESPEPAANGSSSSYQETSALENVRSMTEELSRAVEAVSDALQGADGERRELKAEVARMQAQIEELRKEADRAARYRAAVLEGQAASVTPSDLEALETMTDSLTQDPDRLTVLFGVVQHAPKLATAVSVFAQLRRMAEEG